MSVISDIEPAGVWRWFEAISAIPRPSGSEGRIADFLVEFATVRQLPWKRDRLDNVLISTVGRGVHAGAAPLLLQAHVDIVPEKLDGCDHDFQTDPIVPVIDGDWVTSHCTTLGADNGIGVAFMLAALDGDLPDHPPLECLFTTDEERGLTGASSIDPGWISARRMINLDSEEEGVFCIGCAGGLDFTVEFPLAREASRREGYRLTVSGLRGGHSGMAIGLSRANAIRILARALRELCFHHGCSVCDMEGGSKRNAIPRSASAILTVPDGAMEEVNGSLALLREELALEYEGIEDRIAIDLSPAREAEAPLLRRSCLRALDFLLALPHGVRKMSGVADGLVETSVNMALLRMEGEGMEVVFSARSPLSSGKIALADSARAVCELAGAVYREGHGYPGWTPNRNSELLATAEEVYRTVFGKDASVEVIHAGLECGIVGDRVGGMDMISIGPDIRGVHVPGEKVSIPSMVRFHRFFAELLAALD